MTIGVEQIHQVFAASFPAKAALASVEYVEAVAVDDGFAVVMRLFVFEPGESGPSIRDIKEQQVWLGALRETSVERLGEFARALVTVLVRVLERVEIVEDLMPHELVIANVLKLANAQTEDQFGRALLVKSRLGKYLA